MRIKQLRIFLLACAPLLLAGCLDVFFDPVDPAPPPVDPPVSEARVRFDRDVYPILSVNCAGCHSETEGSVLGFVGVDPARAYERILGFPDLLGGFLPTAPIATVPAAGHMGVLYTSAERAAIAAWLDAELAERGGTPPPSPTIETLIQTWSGCLDFGDFTAAGMAPAWSALTTSSGACTSCHANGGFGVLVTPDAQEFFRLMTTRRTYLLGLFTVELSGGPAAAKMIPHDDRFLSVASQQPPHSQHPAFNYPNSPARVALQDLHAATAARRDTASCGPPRLLD